MYTHIHTHYTIDKGCTALVTQTRRLHKFHTSHMPKLPNIPASRQQLLTEDWHKLLGIDCSLSPEAHILLIYWKLKGNHMRINELA